MIPVSLKDLAKELNLSVSTVSKALNDCYDISAETKRKAFALAAKMNYHPNPYATGLRKQNSKTIAVIIPEIANHFFSLAINGIESVAKDRGYHFLIYLTHEDYQKEIEITKHFQNGRVDGLLLSLSSETSNVAHIEELLSRGVKIVSFDRVSEKILTSRVNTNDFQSSYLATEHLIERGCRNIAFLSNSKNLSTNNNRMKGYIQALARHQLPVEDHLVFECTNDNDHNYQLISDILQRKNRPDGIFASVEKIAMTTYHVCHDLGIDIPKDIKILSFSNLEIASFLNPSLTTITQPAFEIGQEAASILFNLLEAKKNNSQILNKTLNSKLIIRNSTN
jgi:LacI family transcriptional regulator